MKKILAFAMAAVLMLGLAACGGLAVLAQIFERRKTRGRHHRQDAFFLNLLHNGRPAC